MGLLAIRVAMTRPMPDEQPVTRVVISNPPRYVFYYFDGSLTQPGCVGEEIVRLCVDGVHLANLMADG